MNISLWPNKRHPTIDHLGNRLNSLLTGLLCSYRQRHIRPTSYINYLWCDLCSDNAQIACENSHLGSWTWDFLCTALNPRWACRGGLRLNQLSYPYILGCDAIRKAIVIFTFRILYIVPVSIRDTVNLHEADSKSHMLGSRVGVVYVYDAQRSFNRPISRLSMRTPTGRVSPIILPKYTDVLDCIPTRDVLGWTKYTDATCARVFTISICDDCSDSCRGIKQVLFE